MPITKETVVDSISVNEDGSLVIREATFFVEDGVRAENPVYHRRFLDVGADVTAEDPLVKDVALGIHTANRIAAKEAKKLAPSLFEKLRKKAAKDALDPPPV